MDRYDAMVFQFWCGVAYKLAILVALVAIAIRV